MQAWRSLFDAIAPDLLLADHAPTALLAARGRPGLRRALIGSGFFQPPAQQPLPSLREWERVPAQRLAQSETRVLDTCNAVLAASAKANAAAHSSVRSTSPMMYMSRRKRISTPHRW